MQSSVIGGHVFFSHLHCLLMQSTIKLSAFCPFITFTFHSLQTCASLQSLTLTSLCCCLCVCAELYNICLSRAKEKWKSTATLFTETESEGGVSKENFIIILIFFQFVFFNVLKCLADVGSSDRESSLELIKLDISRTFPQLCIFQKVSERELE